MYDSPKPEFGLCNWHHFCLYNAGGKLDKYLPRADHFKQGLYMFDIGQNDLAGAFYRKSEDQIIASIPTILEEFETGIKVCTLVISIFLILY